MANPMNKILALIAAMIAHNRHTAPIFNLFEFGIQNGQTAAYDQFGENNIRTSLTKETGTLAMHSVKQKANPQITYMIEIYADDAAYQAHRKTPHFQKYLQETADLLQDKTFIEITPTLLMNKGVL